MYRKIDTALKFNRDMLRDKIYACWLGKNIGGNLGMPIEGKRSICDVKDFYPGEVFSNDDLDLQLVWMRAVDELGPENIDAQALGEYWLSYIGVNWNEYGVCKMNMRDGLLPPMCGEAGNDEWKHSNGAWIRTEIWACLSPGCPEQALKFAFEDSCVDHGLSEGTYAAIFFASLESAAFVINDMETLVAIGLSKIPEGCRIAQSVKLVLDCYKRNLPWQKARELVVKDSEDLGWMQAPANVAYTIIGLLYGEGDFKKTVLTAINCGDDTDCTGATAGAVMGIAFGTKCIPADWRGHLGDEIVTSCIIKGQGCWVDTCTELTECIIRLLPTTTRAKVINMVPNSLPIPDSNYDLPIVIYDGSDDFSALSIDRFMGSAFMNKLNTIAARSRYVIHKKTVFADLWIELDGEPFIEPDGELTGRVSVGIVRMPEQKRFRLNWICPEGWKVTGPKNISTSKNDTISWDDQSRGKLSMEDILDQPLSTRPFVINAGENVEANNKIILEVQCTERLSFIYIPIVLFG